jgi:hypothetical protein
VAYNSEDLFQIILYLTKNEYIKKYSNLKNIIVLENQNSNKYILILMEVLRTIPKK